MQEFVADARFALRSFVKRPAFSAAALLAVAIGVCATSSVFSAFRGVLLAPLAAAHPERMLWLHGTWSKGTREGISPNDFRDFRRHATSFEHLVASTNFAPLLNLDAGGEPQQVSSRQLSAGFFAAFGLRPLLGREFEGPDESVGSARVALLSEGLWRRSFGADQRMLGRSLALNGLDYRVVGVIPHFRDVLGSNDVYLPFQADSPALRRVRFMTVLGRLKPGVTIRGAQAELNTLAAGLEAAYPDTNKTWRVALQPLADTVVGPARPLMNVLMGAVGCLLLITVANIASLLLARLPLRERELTLRTALGATRGRVARQMLTESLVLGLAGGLLGLLLTFASVHALRALAPASVPRLDRIGVDWPVLVFALAVALATGLLCGLMPALRVSRLDLNTALKSGAASAQAGSGPYRRLLVVTEVALSVLLLVSAALLGRSLFKLQQVDPGFRSQGMLATRVVLPQTKYPRPEQRALFWRSLLERLRQASGVAEAAATTELPLSGQANPVSFTAKTPTGDTFVINLRSVSPGYPAILGVPLVDGRALTSEDRADTQQVLLINERMRRDIYGERSAVGEKLIFDFGAGPSEATVVGVVADFRHESLATAPGREAYFPIEQTPLQTYNIVVRAREGEPEALAGAVRASVRALDPGQSVGTFRTLDAIVAEHLREPRFRALLLASFSALALLLAAFGLYAVLSDWVAQRTREIGVRAALGAAPSTILRLVVGQGLILSGIGVVVGLLGAVATGRLLSSLLYGVTKLDPLAFVIGPGLLALAAVLASYLPGLRATRVQVTQALRYE